MTDKNNRVLLIEDDVIDQLAFRRLVEDQKLPYAYTIAGSVAEARWMLSRKDFDIVISDYSLGDGTAFDAIDFRKKAPVIMITGVGNEDIAVTAMKKGAYDYLTKDLERNYLKVLPLIIENAIRRKKVNEQLALLSHALMSVNDSVYITDMKNRITYVNAMFCRTYGYNEKEIVGKPCDILWIRNKSGTGVLKPEEPLSTTEHLDVRKDGSSFPASLSRSYLKDAEGKDIAIVRVVRDVTERKKMENLLEAAAITDDLTGLLNRRGFYTLADQQCRLADRTKRGLSLLFVDLDKMKQINDELGHEAGDLALKDTADILNKTFRESDIIARMGGDEFAVLITEPSRPGIEYVILNHLKNNLAKHNEEDHRKFKLSLSIGIANYNPDSPCTVSDLLTRADALMYEDKKRCKTGPLSEERETERRAYERFSTGANHVAALDGKVKAVIKDISMGGICLRTSTPMKKDSIHNIHLISPDDKETGHKGIVVRSSLAGSTIEKAGNLHGTEVGIRFIRMSIEEKNSLNIFINNFMV